MAVSEAVSRELFGLITEFLQWHDFPLTLEAFAAERKAKRKQVSSSVSGKPLAGKERSSACSALLRKFDDGKRDEFFALWQQYVPAAMLARHPDTHKAEFHLQIYFALYPILPRPSLSLSTASNAMGGPHSSTSSSRQELAQRMRSFKHYLETQGAGLAVTAELLPFYALPYVPHPETHPSYQHMFDGQWSVQQRRSLKAFLDAIPGQDGATPPGLYMLYAQAVQSARATASGAIEGPSTAAGCTIQQHHSAGGNTIGSRPVSALLKGEAELSDVIAAADSSGREPHTDAVLPLDATYGAVHYGGDPAVSSGGGEAGRTSQDEDAMYSSFGASSTHQQASEALPPIDEQDSEADDDDEDAASEDPSSPSPIQPTDSTPDSAAAKGPSAASRPKAYHLTDLPPLDYAKVKAGLQSRQPQLVARLLQALRWRLTCCAPGVERFAVITGWIERDLLGMHDAPEGAGSIAEVITSSQDPGVCYQLARLLNAIASDRAGRAYLLQQCPHTISLLLQLLTHTGSAHNVSASDTPLQQQALAALQKLSLKRRAQSAMIAQGALEWVIGFLGSAATPAAPASGSTTGSRRVSAAAAAHSPPGSAQGSRRQSASGTAAPEQLADGGRAAQVADTGGHAEAAAGANRPAAAKQLLSDFSVEYGAALLMNLVLRRAGKARCEGCAVALLRVCIGMLESANEQVRTYINGTLYATLARASIRHAAASLGLERLLQEVAARSSPTFARQVEFIQRQLSLDASAGDVTARGGREDASDDDAAPDGDAYVDDDDACFEDAEEEDLHVTGSLEEEAAGQSGASGVEAGDAGAAAREGMAACGEGAFGEALLAAAYLAGPEEAKSEMELMRASIVSCTLSADASGYSGIVSTAATVRGSASFYGGSNTDVPLSRPITPAGSAGAMQPYGSAAAGGQLQSGRSSLWRAEGGAGGKLLANKSSTGSTGLSQTGGGLIAAYGAKSSSPHAQPRHHK